MNSSSTNAHNFLSKRKCFFLTGCLIFGLLMSQVSCRPSETDDVPAYNDGDYTDADDIEWQNIPVVEPTTKDHPIIYYKEDIVSEDYDPNKENKSSSKEQETEIKPMSRRKYKEISRRNRINRTENYRYVKPEKVLFDIYPIEDDGIKEDETKFNDNDIHIEVISLVDDNNSNNNSNNSEESSTSKHILNKRPKKYSRRHRQRRDVTASLAESDDSAQHALRHKRNPYLGYYGYAVPHYRGVFIKPNLVLYPVKIIKHPVRGRPINTNSPEGTFYTGRRTTTTTTTTVAPSLGPRIDGPVWGSSEVTTQRNPVPNRPTISEPTIRPSRRPAPPIIHTGDEDYVPQSNRQPTLRPSAQESLPGGRWNQQELPAPTVRPIIRTTTAPPPPPPSAQETESRGVSSCIWAISTCCRGSKDIRYQCFEALGCSGAFWDLNPCAEDIFSRAVEAVDQYID